MKPTGEALPLFRRAEMLLRRGEAKASLELVEQGLRLAPKHTGGLCLRGEALLRIERWADAGNSFGRAAQLNERLPGAWRGMGTAFARAGFAAQAAEAYGRALQLVPEHPRLRWECGLQLRLAGRLEEAQAVLDYPQAREPDSLNLRALRAECLLEQGRVDEARAVAIEPDDARPRHRGLHANWIRASLYSPEMDGPALRAAAEHWVACHAPPAEAPAVPLPSAEPPYRIGILNTCCHAHNTAQHLLGWLPHVDRNEFEIYLYPAGPRKDRITDQLRSLADGWNPVYGLDDAAAAARIREDRLHVLVEMNEFANSGRLGVCSLRPAPLMIHWYGNAITTGLSSLAGRISDPVAEPDGEADSWSTERIFRFEGGYYAYTPPPGSVDPSERVDVDRPVTLGAIHHLAKYSAPYLELLRRIMKACPEVRLLLARRALEDSGTREHFEKRLADAGLPMERVELRGDGGAISSLRIFREFDLVPDAFPFTGDATTGDALWMSVPVLTLAGRHLCARRGAAQLTAAGFPELATVGPEDYVRRAVELIRDPVQLARLRREIGKAYRASPLCDGRRLARNMEGLFRNLIKREKTGNFLANGTSE